MGFGVGGPAEGEGVQGCGADCGVGVGEGGVEGGAGGFGAGDGVPERGDGLNPHVGGLVLQRTQEPVERLLVCGVPPQQDHCGLPHPSVLVRAGRQQEVQRPVKVGKDFEGSHAYGRLGISCCLHQSVSHVIRAVRPLPKRGDGSFPHLGVGVGQRPPDRSPAHSGGEHAPERPEGRPVLGLGLAQRRQDGLPRLLVLGPEKSGRGVDVFARLGIGIRCGEEEQLAGFLAMPEVAAPLADQRHAAYFWVLVGQHRFESRECPVAGRVGQHGQGRSSDARHI